MENTLSKILILINFNRAEKMTDTNCKDVTKIELKAKLSIFLLLFSDFREGSLSTALIKSTIEALRPDDLKEGSEFYSIKQAYDFARKIFDKLKPEESFLFNIMSLVNSDTRKTNSLKDDDLKGDGFYFNEKNNYKRTVEDLKEIFPEYIIIINSNKLHDKEYCHGISDFNKMLFINIHKLESVKTDPKRFMIGLFFILLHEFAHIKRICFASHTHLTKSPKIVTKHSNLNNEDKMDIGAFLENVLLVKLFILIYREIHIIKF
jgi:hypothetical protein